MAAERAGRVWDSFFSECDGKAGLNLGRFYPYVLSAIWIRQIPHVLAFVWGIAQKEGRMADEHWVRGLWMRPGFRNWGLKSGVRDNPTKFY